MHYLHFPWRLRERSRDGWGGVSYQPIEEFRAWAWEHGIRYVLRRVYYVKDLKDHISMWIGFHNDNHTLVPLR
jgi:hypothetical protein